jgi:hypothetical protein
VRRLLVALACLWCVCGASAQEVRFKPQEIEKGLTVGYAVTLVDVDGDQKLDIVVVDSNRVLWYQNPTWKPHVVIQGGTKADNVCIAAHDIDGDGKVDLALGAYWKPADTKTSGTLQWLKRGATLDDPWTIHPIDTEPTIHRIKFIDVDGTGQPALVSVPLQGRGSSAKGNWMDGEPVRVTAYRIPTDPIKDRWVPDVLSNSLHVVHNFVAIPGVGKAHNILAASYEGVSAIEKKDGKWSTRKIGSGNQDNPKGSLGASEIKQGVLKNGKKFIATVEPWHGFQIVVYTEPADPVGMWKRHLIDDELKWGHAVSVADLDGDGSEELIIGVRDDGGKIRRGVRVYRATDEMGSKWARQIVDDGGVAVEDLATADLDGDGKIDLVAAGRATKNVRIYWNQGK